MVTLVRGDRQGRFGKAESGKRKAESRKPKAGGGRQEAGGGRREAGGRRREAGGGRREAGGGRREAGGCGTTSLRRGGNRRERREQRGRGWCPGERTTDCSDCSDQAAVMWKAVFAICGAGSSAWRTYGSVDELDCTIEVDDDWPLEARRPVLQISGPARIRLFVLNGEVWHSKGREIEGLWVFSGRPVNL